MSIPRNWDEAVSDWSACQSLQVPASAVMVMVRSEQTIVCFACELINMPQFVPVAYCVVRT